MRTAPWSGRGSRPGSIPPPTGCRWSPRISARTGGGSRRYSEVDIDRLRRIQELTNEGLNLAGVKMVLELEEEMTRLRDRMAQLQEDARHAIDAAHRTYRRDLVPLNQSVTLFRSR